MRRSATLALVLLAGCATGDDFLAVDQQAIDDQAVLDLVNAPATDFGFLNDTVRLDGRAANGIAFHVRGADGQFGTADDRPFASIAEIDAVPYVGPAALGALRAYAEAHVDHATILVEGVLLTQEQVDAIVTVCNTAVLATLVDQIHLTRRAATRLVAARPFADIQAIAAVKYVANQAIFNLRLWVIAHPPSSCSATGGSFDGVSFADAEVCHAIDFANHARYSQMGAITSRARAAIYDGLVGPYRTSSWQDLGAIAGAAGVSPSAMTALKTAAAAWTDDGLHYDTIEHTWDDRVALEGQPVTLESVFGTKKLPTLGGNDPNGFPEYCVELRDSKVAANFLPACVTLVNADSAPACAGEGCADSMLDRFVWVRGTLERDTRVAGGFKLHVQAGALPKPGNPNPN